MQKDYKKPIISTKNKSDPRLQSHPSKKPTNPTTPISTYTPSSHPSNSKSISLPKEISSMTPQIADLLYSREDTYEDLIAKNMKLRTLVIQASTTITELSRKKREIEQTCNEEKEAILIELDRISQNYQLYAESHKQINKIRQDHQQLITQYNQNNQVMQSYQQSIVSLLKDNMKTFANVTNMINIGVKSAVTPQEFLYDMRQFLWDNLNKYHLLIDSVVFGSFYEEYTGFLTLVNEEEEKNTDMTSTMKKKKPSIRKKEYIDTSNPPQSQSHRYSKYTSHCHKKSFDVNNKNGDDFRLE